MDRVHEVPPDGDQAVRLLLRVGDLDTAYRALYLQRARRLAEPFLSRSAYERLLRASEQLDDTRRTVADAVESADWRRVQELAERAERLGDLVQGRRDLLDFGHRLYRGSSLVVSPFAAIDQGLTAQHRESLESLRREIVADLQRLVVLDPPSQSFYQQRSSYFSALRFHRDAWDPDTPPSDAHAVRRALQEAVRSQNWGQVRRLGHALATQAPHAPATTRQLGDIQLCELSGALPEAARRAAEPYGLVACTLAEAPTCASYVGGGGAGPASLRDATAVPFDRHGDRAPLAMQPSDVLTENLALLIRHPFISSAGVRYLPPFGGETLLAEAFPESEPDQRTSLLEALHLPRRIGRSRVEIESALQEHGEGLIRGLQLDPTEFALVCIPFDAYLRLAPHFDWGRRQLWTHFDGYEVVRGGNFLALVGGDARYGGPADLCGIGRTYTQDRITLRLAVVRRRRLTLAAGVPLS